MNKVFSLFFFVSLIHLFVNSEYTLNTLFIVHRHGDRVHAKTFPNDLYINETNFPDGFGQLTSKGKMRMYNIGQYIKDRYQNFLSNNVHEVYARSSGKERCIESIQLLVNGAYKPEGRWIWNKDVNFQPIAIQTTDYYHDMLLNMFSLCPAGSEELEKIIKSEYGLDIDRKYKQLFNNLTNFTGQKIENLFDVDYIHDTLTSEKSIFGHQFVRPEWLTDKILRDLNHIHLLKFQMFSQTEKIQKLRLGVFLNELTFKINQSLYPIEKKFHFKDADDSRVRKVNIYSTHDIFLFNLLNAMKIKNHNLIPDFGASIIFEIHQNENQDKNSLDESSIVKIFYLNHTRSDDFKSFQIYPLQIDDCSSNCSVKTFLSSFSKLLITEEEWINECNHKDKNKDVINEVKQSTTGYVTTIVIETIFLVLIIGFIIKIKFF